MTLYLWRRTSEGGSFLQVEKDMTHRLRDICEQPPWCMNTFQPSHAELRLSVKVPGWPSSGREQASASDLMERPYPPQSGKFRSRNMVWLPLQRSWERSISMNIECFSGYYRTRLYLHTRHFPLTHCGTSADDAQWLHFGCSWSEMAMCRCYLVRSAIYRASSALGTQRLFSISEWDCTDPLGVSNATLSPQLHDFKCILQPFRTLIAPCFLHPCKRSSQGTGEPEETSVVASTSHLDILAFVNGLNYLYSSSKHFTRLYASCTTLALTGIHHRVFFTIVWLSTTSVERVEAFHAPASI